MTGRQFLITTKKLVFATALHILLLASNVRAHGITVENKPCAKLDDVVTQGFEYKHVNLRHYKNSRRLNLRGLRIMIRDDDRMLEQNQIHGFVQQFLCTHARQHTHTHTHTNTHTHKHKHQQTHTETPTRRHADMQAH